MRIQMTFAVTAIATAVWGAGVFGISAAQAQPADTSYAKGLECSALYKVLGASLPAEQKSDVMKRSDIWYSHARKTGPGSAKDHYRARIAVEKVLMAKMRSAGGDKAKTTAILAPLGKACEKPPRANAVALKRKAPKRTLAYRKPKPKVVPKKAITERERKNGDLAIRCAGMAQVYAADPLAVSLYGKESVYRQIIAYYRPDLTGAPLEQAIKLKSQEHARLYLADRKKRIADMQARREVPENSYESSRRASECARAVNQLRAVKIID